MTVLRQNLFRLWLLISILWLVASAWIITREWSGDSVSSREYLLFNEPVSWGEQHPECRNRFGFWPDGTRMKASEIDDAVYYILAKQRTLTPEEVARSKWARDVGAKIAACEEAQWMPIVNPAPLQTDCRTTTMSSLIVPLGSYRAIALLLVSKFTMPLGKHSKTNYWTTTLHHRARKRLARSSNSQRRNCRRPTRQTKNRTAVHGTSFSLCLLPWSLGDGFHFDVALLGRAPAQDEEECIKAELRHPMQQRANILFR